MVDRYCIGCLWNDLPYREHSPCLQFDLCNCVGSYLVQTVLPTLLCAVQHKIWLVPRLPTKLCTIARLPVLYDEVLYDKDVKLSLPVPLQAPYINANKLHIIGLDTRQSQTSFQLLLQALQCC